MTPSRVDWIMNEIQRMTRRFDNHVLPAGEVPCAATYLCELWDELYDMQRALHKTYSELAVMDPTIQEPVNVAA